MGASARAEAERQLASIRAEVDRITKRRDAITAQLASLRDVVAGFGTDDDATSASAPTSGDDKAGT